MEKIFVTMWFILAAYEFIGWLAVVTLLSIDLYDRLRDKHNRNNNL